MQAAHNLVGVESRKTQRCDFDLSDDFRQQQRVCRANKEGIRSGLKVRIDLYA